VILTVWLTVPLLYPKENFRDEMITSLAYSCVLFMVMAIAYIIEIQQKKAFYFLWQADQKAKWLTSILDNLNSGFVSIKNGEIKYINSFFINHLEKLKHNTEDVKEVKSDIFSTRKEG
jgi:cell shape-determining protein MreC